MSPTIIVYSPDQIRGRIVFKILRLNGIKTLLFSNRLEAEEAVNEHPPSILIIDAKTTLSSELSFLKALSLKLQNTSLLVLSDTPDVPALKNLGLENPEYVSDPFDPEHIVSVVKYLLASRGEKFTFWKFLQELRKVLNYAARLFLKGLLIATILFIGLTGGYVYWCISTLPNIVLLEEYSPYESSRLYSNDNMLLTEFYVERRTFVPYSEIPEHVKDAFIAAEDTRFYSHHGIDVIRIIGALIADIREGSFVQGGSTITQQLAKMLFLKPEKTITRKIKEIALSLRIEKKYTKDEILGLYLNQAYFGTRAYGVEAACQVYFGAATNNITISEAALLATLPKAPSKYSPFKDPRMALKRRNYILKKMLKAGFISDRDYKDSLSDPIPKTFHGRKYKAPYFVDYCRGILEKKYGDRLYISGLRIYTTLDYRMQQIAEKAVQKGIEELKKRVKGEVQAALLSIDLWTGHIRAMVGGADFWESQFNRVTQAKRQPGSAFKPFVYLTAFERGFGQNDTIMDKRIAYRTNDKNGTWAPRNYNNVYHGAVTLKTALALSLNAAAVNLAKKVGIGNVIKTARRLGVRSRINPLYSSALGASELALMEMVYAYTALAPGNRIEPVSISKIIDKEQLILLEPSGLQQRVVKKKALKRIRHALRAVILEGTGRKAKVLNRAVYGKTGTTNDHADAWFIGFDDNIAVGVWVGRDSRTTIGNKETGSSAALPIWIDYMRNISEH